MRKYLLAAGASCIALGLAMPTFAQETDNNLIIVTGQKRDENLQDISVAATVLSGESLVNQGVERFDDLQTVAPSLSVSDSGLTQSVNIRGIGLASGSPNAANGVATYFDGVFQPPIVTTNSFYDLGSVEVFRGPQGTFIGSNSTGGAIFINSRDPDLKSANGYFELEAGNYARYGAQAAGNMPITNTLAIRAAGIFRRRNSFFNTPTNISDPARLNEVGGRLGIYWEPSSNFNALIKAEVADKKTGGYAYRTLGTIAALQPGDNIRDLQYNSPTKNDENAEQITAKLEYTMDNGPTLRVVSGYQNKRIRNLYDTDGTNTPPDATQDQFVQEKVYTGEVNLISPADRSFRWIAGYYYQRNEITVDITNNAAFFPLDIDIANVKKTTGVFGQVSYDLSDQFSVDIGGRYSTYDIVGVGAVRLRLIGPPPGLQVADPGGAYHDNQFTGKIALNFKPNADHLFYAFAAKGYKSGGFASPTTSFQPETVFDYEIGWKGTFAGGKVTTQFGAFYYDYKDFQLDALDVGTGSTSLINLTDATVKGIEGQIQARSGGFDLTAGFAYTDSSLAGTDFVDTRSYAAANPTGGNLPQCAPGQNPGNPATCADYAPFIRSTAGGPNLYSPKFTFNATVAYTFDAQSFSVTPRVSFSHLGARYTYIAYDPVRDRLPAYDLVNAGVSVDFGKMNVDFWANNLFDKEFLSGQGDNREYYGAPREYGVRARVEF